MQGDPEVLDALGDVLAAELTAINQYFLHAKMCANWGYGKLAHKKREESIEEMKDADAIMERILYFDGVPNMMRMNPVKVGENAIEQHELDLALEKSAVDRLNNGDRAVRAKGRQRHARTTRARPQGRRALDRLARDPTAPGRRRSAKSATWPSRSAEASVHEPSFLGSESRSAALRSHASGSSPRVTSR